MTPAEIRIAQQRLWELGYGPGPVDGVVGPRTTTAALRYAVDALNDRPTADPETALLTAELERDEGRVLHAYQDSIGYWTIGIGRLIDKRRGGGITDAEADLLKRNDIAKVRAQLDERLPWWSGLDNVRKRAIQNMAFQLGIGGLMGFTATLPLIRDGHYSQAAANLRQSKWAGQTPSRAKRVIRMIETGFA